MEQVVLQGHKGGEKSPHQPAETRNNLLSKSYAKVLLAIGEGEFAGVPTAADIYLDGTPLVSSTGLQNFGGVKWEYRPGTVDQTHIQGMPEVSNEFPIGFTLTNTVPYTRLITDSQLDAVRVTLSWPALLQQKDNGDIVGYNIVYAIDISTNGGAYVEQGQWDTNTGKTTVEYNRTHRINLPKTGTSWTLRVRRITPNQNNAKFQDTMTVKTFAEVIDAKLRYPNTALLYVEFDAELFGGTSIPRISLKTKGRLVQVPANYDPATRTYSGVWNGTFKWAWTDNPAWVFYDLVTNERFGLGSRITPAMVDKWTLYQVSQYCDVLVSDGKGGQEPRYTCNIYIQSRKEAWQVLRDIVGIFNGMLYWSGTQMVASADMPVAVNTVRNYSRSNVIDGKFSYGSTSEKTIYTTALVSYDNPDNHFETAVEAVNDLNLVQRYKTWAQAELSAIGCTSRGQAQRKGKYTMLTNSLNRVVTFKLGLEGYLPKPGEVIGVADQVMAGASLAGRISAATTNTVTVDRVPSAAIGDILYVNKADGIASEGRTIQSISGKTMTVTTPFSVVPSTELSWYVEKVSLKSQLFRITKVTWNDDQGQYEVTGVQYEDSKYSAVDTGARLESRPITSIPAGGQAGPTNLIVSSFTYLEQTMAVTNLSVKWTPAAGAMNYEGQWRKDGGDWINVGLTATTGFDVKGIYTGAYQARVRAVNAAGIKSVWVESTNTQINGKVGTPPALTSLTTLGTVFGIQLNWTFPPGAEDTARTEIMYGPTTSFGAATKLGDFAYPQQMHTMNGLKAGATFFFWGRLVDRSGNVGPYYPLSTLNGVMGQSSTDLNEYEEYFLGQINESALGQQLAEKIDKIELIDGITVDLDRVSKDVNWIDSQIGGIEAQLQNDIGTIDRTLTAAIDQTNEDVDGIKGDVSDLNETVSELQSQVDDIVDALAYDPTKTYKAGDTVRVDNRLFQARMAVPVNTTPPNDTYWQDVGQVVSGYGALVTQVSSNTTTITSQGNTITAHGQQLDALGSRVTTAEGNITGNTSAISNLQTTVTQHGNDITSQGQSITSIEADVTNLQTSVAGNSSAISSLNSTVSTQGNTITSQGQSITSLQNSVSSLQTTVSGVQSTVSAQGTAITGLTNTVTQQGNTITSHGSSITVLEGKVSTLQTDVAGLTTTVTGHTSAISNLQQTVTTQGNSITANSSNITTLQADVSTAKTDISGLKTTTTAQGTAISNLQTTATQQGDAITANSNSITNLTTSVHFNELDALYAGDETDAQIADALMISKATATATESLTTTVSNLDGVVTAQGQSITNLTAELEGIDGDIVGQGNAISSLQTSVTQQGNTITSQGTSITTLNNSLTVTNNNVTTAQAAADSALAQVVTKAEAAAVTALTQRVTNAEGTITTQGQSITTLNNNLTTTNSNVTAAQAAAQAASDKAGLKGEVIYGSSAPAVDKRLPQNLWIDTTGGANTPKRWDGSAWTAVTDKVATDAAAAAASALSQVSTKAEAAAVTALTTRVTTAEGNITSQGNSITSLNNSLTVTNGNVTAAQNAAQAASDLAGGKGEVIYSATAPAVAKQLPQNLWIDTTGNANTPKRWLTNAWVVVTDKVATDAAAAAANALAQVALKADSSAVTALTNTVTQQGNDIATNATNITNLNTQVHFNELDSLYDGNETDAQIADALVIAKAAASANESLTSTVTQQGNEIIAQASKITDLEVELTDVNGVVVSNGTAIENLKTTTTQQGNTVVSQGVAITSLTNRVTNAETGITANATAISTTNTNVSLIDGKLTTTANKVDGIFVQVNPVLAGDSAGLAGDDTLLVGVWSEQSARIEDGIATGQRIDGLQAVVNSNAASIVNEAAVRANADSALATQQSTTQASVDGLTTSVQQTSSALSTLDGKTQAMWSVKLQVNAQGQYVTAGVGLGLENTPGGLQSTFLVNANTFAVVNGVNTTTTAPFIVSGGQVFIKDALIGNGSITNAKIGSVIQSDNYVANTTGWKLDKAGNFEINGNVAGQGKLTITNQLVSVYDAAGVLRVRMGIW